MVNDLRGSGAPREVKFGVKNKLIGIILVAAVVCTVGVFFVTSSSTTAAQLLVARHGPSAPVTDTAH